MKYALHIYTPDHNIVDLAVASLPVINFAAKDVRGELESVGTSEVRVEFRELDSEGQPSRSLLSLAADAETVGDMLKARLAKVRKATAPAAPASQSGE